MKLARTALRKIISRLTQLTPGVFYYSSRLRVQISDRIEEVAFEEGENRTALGTAGIAVCCAMAGRMEPGDFVMMSLEGVEHGDQNHGDFRIMLMRASDDPAEDFGRFADEALECEMKESELDTR